MSWLKEHREKKAREAFEHSLESWQARRDEHAELLEVARNFAGVTSADIMLARGEALFMQVTDCALIEERATRGHYEGRSSGVSIPIGSIGGRSVRYRVGATRGHYVAGAPAPKSIDTGTVYITNQRVVFQGAAQTRECKFVKLIGLHYGDGWTTFSVSNRQKSTTVYYGVEIASAVHFRLDLALAHYKGTVDTYVAQLEKDVTEIDAHRPRAPVAPS
jgi:hypothetical protein